MVLTTGYYRQKSIDVHLVQDNTNPWAVSLAKAIPSSPRKFRRDKNGWLSIDDGLVGRYGSPDQLAVVIDDVKYRIWVEQRGPNEFGLVPTNESGDYSNKFIGITENGGLKIEDDWKLENGTVWVVASAWDGTAGQ